ncbi:MAG: kelch repeat-containing protein [Terriglobales bacterium]
MRVLHAFGITCVVLLLGLATVSAQTWTPLTNPPTFAASTALLLTGGSVMVHDAGAQDWWKLTPDAGGSYINGTWSQLASLPAGYSPLYYASAVLRDGRVIVMGGEYNFFNAVWTNLGAIYNPLTNKWKKMTAPAGWTTIGDAQSTTLFNGTFMLANCCTAEAALLDAKTLTWTPVGTGKADINDEEGWTLLPNGHVLTVDAFNGINSELFDPASGVWSSAGNTVVQLVESRSHELGPAVLRPDGTVFATGATGHNAIYDTATGLWSAGPDFPKVNLQFLDIADGPAALLPNGNVLCGASPGVFKANTRFFEFDGTNLTQVAGTPNSPNFSSFEGRMLVLPTGQVLFTDGTSDVEIYTSAGSPNPAWAPAITKVAKTLIHGNGYALKGTQLNGLSEAGAYGDDAQAATNYPLVRITNTATGHVFFARTKNHSSMGVATGSAIVTTHFKVPAGIELGAGQLEVVANGIASSPVSVTIN